MDQAGVVQRRPPLFFLNTPPAKSRIDRAFGRLSTFDDAFTIPSYDINSQLEYIRKYIAAIFVGPNLFGHNANTTFRMCG
jgi:hypothetical protein